MTENGKALLTLTTKYGKICMYGGIITNLNPLTFHHCFKLKRDGGAATEYNGSAPTRLSHSEIHILSDNDRAWNNRLKDYVREYKSYLRPSMSCEEFVALKVVQQMRLEIHAEMEKAVADRGYEAYLTKGHCYEYRKRR